MAFKIGPIYHLIHLSDDFAELNEWYWEVFRVRGGWHFWPPRHYAEIEKRDAELVALADVVIEPMAPAMRAEGWDTLPVGRFYKRFGRHWHSIAWLVDGIPDLYDTLKAHNVRFFALGGGSVNERPDRTAPLFTHPKDTVGALELLENRTPAGGGPPGGDPRFLPGYDSSWWARKHPLGIERLLCMTIVCSDPERARHVYVDVLGGRVIHESDSALLQTRSAFVNVGDYSVVELATPNGKESLASADLAANGEILHSVTWNVVDLDAAQQYLLANGIHVLQHDASTLVCDPRDTYGAAMRFTTWRIPGDPRSPIASN